MQSYGCCKCQTRHYEDESLFDAHIYHQSKHGISYDFEKPSQKMTAENLTADQVAHMMNIEDVKEGDFLLFMPTPHKSLAAIDSYNPKAVIGKVLSVPVKGFAGYYNFKTDLHRDEYRHHLNDLVAIVEDLLTKQQRATVSSLVNTSADDCKVSLSYVGDLDVLREALRVTIERGYKTKAAHIERRINRIIKEVK